MPKLYSSSEIIKVLQKKGFIYISQKGSHGAVVKPLIRSKITNFGKFFEKFF